MGVDGLEPAPERSSKTDWKEFPRPALGEVLAADFFGGSVDGPWAAANGGAVHSGVSHAQGAVGRHLVGCKRTMDGTNCAQPYTRVRQDSGLRIGETEVTAA